MKKTAVYLLVAILTLAAVSAWAQNADQGTRQRQRQPGAPGAPGAPAQGLAQGFAGRMMVSSPAQAVNPPMAQMVERQAEILQLTDDQKTSVTTLLTNRATAVQPLQQKLSQACQALRTAVAAQQYDAAKVKTLAAQAQAAEAAVVDAHIATWAHLRTILSAEQIGKLQQGGWMRQPPTRDPGAAPGGQPARPRNGQFAPPPPGGQDAPPPPME